MALVPALLLYLNVGIYVLKFYYSVYSSWAMMKSKSTDWAWNEDIKNDNITTIFSYGSYSSRNLLDYPYKGSLILHYLKIHYAIEVRTDHIDFSWITKFIATHGITLGINHVTQN